jgi:hypothetical protein
VVSVVAVVVVVVAAVVVVAVVVVILRGTTLKIPLTLRMIQHLAALTMIGQIGIQPPTALNGQSLGLLRRSQTAPAG